MPETGLSTDGTEEDTARVERVIAVAPRMSGTHLVQELMVRLGYRVHGESVPPADGAVELSIRQPLDLARHYLHPDEQARLDFRHDREGFVRTTNQLWFQVAEVWQTRLAAVNVTHTVSRSGPRAPDASRRVRFSFGSTPANLRWTAHSAVAGTLFYPDAHSFHRGRIGTWRGVFTHQHERLFQQRFGHLLELFGYV